MNRLSAFEMGRGFTLRKFFTLLLSMLLVCSTFSAAFMQTSGSAVLMMGFEMEDNNRQWQDNLFFTRMEERTGIRFDFLQYGDFDAYQAKLDSLNPGDAQLPGVLFKARLSPATAGELYQKQVLIDLSPYLEQYAPNLSALMRQDPAIRQAITLPGGVIPALPYIAQTPGQNILWINHSWLEALNLSMPRTAAELEQVLLAFLEKDPNRNGRNDEIPLSFIGPYDLKYLAHAWGLAANDFNIYLRDGQARFMPKEDAFEEFTIWCARLFAQGLLDRNGFTTVDTLRRQTDAKADNRYGAFFGPLPTSLVPVEWAGQYQAMMPLTYQGTATYRAVAGRVSYGAFALTTACKDVPAMLAWVDTLYTQEGAILAGIGLEGEDYVVDGDGSWRLLREAGDRSYFARSVIATDQFAPGISSDDFQILYTDPMVKTLTEQTRAVAAQSVIPFPELPLSAEQAAVLAPMQARLGRYVDESFARFVLGEWPADSEHFQLFRDGLQERGVEEFIAFWQEVFEGSTQDAGT